MTVLTERASGVLGFLKKLAEVLCVTRNVDQKEGAGSVQQLELVLVEEDPIPRWFFRMRLYSSNVGQWRHSTGLLATTILIADLVAE